MQTIQVTPDTLACHGCGSTGGVQQGVSGRWFCGGCVQELAAWALAHGAPLAPHLYGNTTSTQEDADEHARTD